MPCYGYNATYMEISMYLKYNRYEESERIRKLGMVIPFSNTERMNFACPRLWSYSHVENYKTSEKGAALSYGIIWHKLLENMINVLSEEDNFRDIVWVENYVSENIDPIIENYYMENANEETLNESFLYGTIQEIRERIVNAIPGWYTAWIELMEKFKVLYVELVVAAPVVNHTGKIIEFPTYVYKEDDYLRPSRTGESTDSELKNIPYYKIGKIDVLLQDRETGDLWICDHKTSSSPAQYESNLSFDVQLPSYASLLDYEISSGTLQHLKEHKVVGVIYDISHSKVKGIPKLLKSGKLSVAKNAGNTSWILKKAIEHYGLKENDYKAHIEFLKNNLDPKRNFHRYFYLNEEDLERCIDEDYGIALSMSSKRKSLVEIESDNIMKFNAISYRYPICQKYGNCTFSSFCLANSPPPVINLDKEDRIKWTTKMESTQVDDLPF